MTGAGVDAPHGEPFGNHARRRAQRLQRDGGRPFRGRRRPQQAHARIGAQEPEQPLEGTGFGLAQQAPHVGGTLRDSGRGAGEMMGVQVVEILAHAGARGHLRMVRTGRHETLARLPGVEVMPFVAKAREQGGVEHHHALVRTVDFVEREQVDVGPQRRHIRQAVAREGDAVDHRQRAGRMHARAKGGNGIDLAEDVRAVRERHQARAPAQQGVESARVQASGLRVHRPFAHHDAALAQPAPDAAVGLVVLVGDDDFVAGRQHAAKGLRQHIGVLRGGRSQVYPVRFDAQIGGQSPMRGIHLLAGPARQGVHAIGLHLGLAIVALQAADHLAAGERTARIVEMGLAAPGRLVEGRELAAREGAIEGGEHGAALSHASRCGQSPRSARDHWP